MIRNIQKPQISPQFTVEDIHKIRKWNYERCKDATVQERIDEIRRQADPGVRAIEKLKAERNVIHESMEIP
jgi:hypothetical protein